MTATTVIQTAQTVIAEATTTQRQASDPACSAWVMASAGSGKTKVLADRVLRLLLAGTAPNRILCLTFTRAAAAEMRNRINNRLERWAIVPNATLADDLTALDNTPPSETAIARARSLFAAVLDTPGGMRIETLHGFCQSLLQRFPLEAGLSPHLQVMDERDAAALLTVIRKDVLNDPHLAPALAVLLNLQSEQGFNSLLDRVIQHRGRFERLLARPDYAETLCRLLGVEPDTNAESLTQALCDDANFDGAALRQALPILMSGGKRAQNHAQGMEPWLAATAQERLDMVDDYIAAMLNSKGEPYSMKWLLGKEMAETPVATVLADESDRLWLYRQRCNTLVLRDATLSLLNVAQCFLDRWRDGKQRRGCLDYDDLILHARALLESDNGAAWVLYKLDGGLDHILLDEAQDTNPDQWAVVKALTDEFFAGQGRNEERDPPVCRTVFAVGDIKQSIYSFQRADPQEFARMYGHYRTRITESHGGLRPVPLRISFRSVAAVLSAVDHVFADGRPARQGLMEDQSITHTPSRIGQGGQVDVWPLLSGQEDDTADSLRLKLAVQVAERITAMIGKEKLPSQDRLIAAGDILVLVRSRNNFVHDLVRELKDRGVAVAGVDRMVLSQQLVVKDLLALAQVLLLPEDSLTLATVLKGPLFRFDEDQLLTLSVRPSGTSLWHSLREKQAQDTVFAAAVETLTDLLNRVDTMAPFDLFSYVLNTLGGRRKFLAQLGVQALDPLDEFISQTLNFETVATPSLQNFLQIMLGDERELKREQEQTGGAVRVMTVHGAKGLQAPVVFLPDTTSPPQETETLLWFGTDEAYKQLVWLPRSDLKDDTCRQAKEALKEAALRESYRLLYVAMTRAEDHLVVCGYQKKNLNPATWYAVIREALQQHPFITVTADDTLILTNDQTAAVAHTTAAVTETPPPPLPAWALTLPPLEETPPRPLTPSRLVADEDEPAVRSPLDRDDGPDPFLRGQIIHTLLQILPDLPEPERLRVARQHLARLAPQWSVERQQAVVDEVTAVLHHPDFAPLFGPGSQAEVPLAGRIGTHHVLAGQVDRLMVTDQAVLVVDYKTNRRPPAVIEDVPEAYLRQMAAYRVALSRIYPEREVRCALLWTDGPTLMPLPPSLLERMTTALF